MILKIVTIYNTPYKSSNTIYSLNNQEIFSIHINNLYLFYNLTKNNRMRHEMRVVGDST